MEDTLTVFKASKYCNVSSKTIINWIEAGHIKAYKTVGGHRRIKRNDMEAFMQRQGIPIPDVEVDDERRRILVVDDDPIIVETIVQALEEDEFEEEDVTAPRVRGLQGLDADHRTVAYHRHHAAAEGAEGLAGGVEDEELEQIRAVPEG